MPEMGRFEGRVALVTGGSSGLGRATAVWLASERANIVVGDMYLGRINLIFLAG